MAEKQKGTEIKVPRPEADVPLGRFMLDHLTPKQIERILDRIDTHASFGKGEKSRV